MADDSQERRERTFEEYFRYSRRQIEILIAPGLLADVETLAQAYLPYLLDGDPEEPTVSRIPGGPTYVREGAPAGMGTPPEFWVRLLIGQAEEGNRGAERAFNAFRSLLGIAGDTSAPTYAELYSGEWRHPTCSGHGR